MDAFWCIVLSTILLRWWWKRNTPDLWEDKTEQPTTPVLNARDVEEAEDKKILTEAQAKLDKEEKEKQKQHDKEILELRKQGYTDDIIAVILPTINNGQ